MQEVLPVVVQPISYPDLRKLGLALKKVSLAIWKAVRGFCAIVFTPPPGQRYIEEQRVRAMRLTGHF